ncbi:predicted protein [Lichtheimia corymbifera JMRC:FSU:9682]|uniref:Uncharacterized protein n=1 Tax=Lichtheimia corymbifera JMRC:FSU:9682 TaxID=1263082 RepID=A0A068RHY7_9FUNG|nr:predicted protein [Lichtheimia corymbifera JMRC:FSU:9682]
MVSPAMPGTKISCNPLHSSLPKGHGKYDVVGPWGCNTYIRSGFDGALASTAEADMDKGIIVIHDKHSRGKLVVSSKHASGVCAPWRELGIPMA